MAYPTVVPIEQVLHHTDRGSLWNVRKMRDVLVKQGQIEPLQVKVYAPETVLNKAVYITFEEDAWGADLVRAAKMLEWPTLLVLVTDRYIQ